MMGSPDVRVWHRGALAGSIGVISALAWLALWQLGAALHGPVHQHHATAGYPAGLLFVGGWTVMTLAMMLPTSLPLLATFLTIAEQRSDRSLLVTLVIGGYVCVWALTGVLFYAGGIAVGALPSWPARAYGPGLILLTAGAYQFTPLKYRCLERCRSPLSFVLGYWQGEHERRNAFRLGAHHGLFCVGCCWALMLLMFVVGVANLAWMLMLGAVMAIEKNVRWGRMISTPVGVLLILGGLAAMAVS